MGIRGLELGVGSWEFRVRNWELGIEKNDVLKTVHPLHRKGGINW